MVFTDKTLIFPPTCQGSLLPLFSIVFCMVPDSILAPYTPSSSHSRSRVLTLGSQTPWESVKPGVKKNCIFIFTYLLLKLSNSFDYECRQQTTAVLAGPVSLSPVKTPGIFISRNSCCRSLKIYIHHYFEITVTIRAATGIVI